ncbi:MAG: hypothetical protein Q6361_07635 [Candidatus Hermodarchaeota archaeon]|nr:hypothetical protein [Candidatus Hermodarchaeota archaeon]
MVNENFQVGELVKITNGEWKGFTGVVSWPVSKQDKGYVLVQSDGKVAGVLTSHDEIEPTDRSAQGFTQLAYQLIRLSSYLIEKAIM